MPIREQAFPVSFSNEMNLSTKPLSFLCAKNSQHSGLRDSRRNDADAKKDKYYAPVQS